MKCLQCGWTWFSRRKYAAGLDYHALKKHGRLTDADVLALIESGDLLVDVVSCVVIKKREMRRGVVRMRRLLAISRKNTRRGGSRRGKPQNGVTYRFVYVCSGTARKKVALHRLVWMAFHRRCVPAGFDVDHIHGPDAGDAITNLRLRTSAENRATNRGAKNDDEDGGFERFDEF